MNKQIEKLINLGLTAEQAVKVIHCKNSLSPNDCLQQLFLFFPIINTNFPLFDFIYKLIFPDWEKIPAPAWFPSASFIATTHLAKTMQTLGHKNYPELLKWSYQHYQDFWHYVCQTLNIKFSIPYKKIVDLTAGIEKPQWFPDASMNITQSCFNADKKAIAIIYQPEQGNIRRITYGELDQLSNQVANSLVKRQFKPGDAIAIDMPMTPECVAIYLGIIKAGCAAVSIADSFAADEIATRLRITKAKAIFTQDVMTRNNKQLPLYEKVIAASAPQAIVLAEQSALTVKLRQPDLNWSDFLDQNKQFNSIICQPQAAINILFSSGTTGDPKAIPWNHTTAIKCASDAYFHQNIQPGDILAWPTNLGWMMGSWLIFASLINQGTMALYGGTPNTKQFGEFIQNTKVTMLGLVPSLVKSWRSTACMEGLNWQAIKLFSSTGECSNVEDMLYLMCLAGNKPVIEYCGGTEIGGAYITGTLIQPAAPAAFTTPTLGLNFVILDEQGHPAHNGEVAIRVPSIGLSTELLNKDHYEVYFANMPATSAKEILRRHGDHIQQFTNGFYRALGRVDDTMNLGGIKISSAELERVIMQCSLITEAAAIAITPDGGGPSQLVIYAVPKPNVKVDLTELKINLQDLIKKHLNPLFKIHQLFYIDAIPRTASNKIMRRILRDEYQNISQ